MFSWPCLQIILSFYVELKMVADAIIVNYYQQHSKVFCYYSKHRDSTINTLNSILTLQHSIILSSKSYKGMRDCVTTCKHAKLIIVVTATLVQTKCLITIEFRLYCYCLLCQKLTVKVETKAYACTCFTVSAYAYKYVAQN